MRDFEVFGREEVDVTASKYVGVQVDMECNADKYWASLRATYPGLARSLERNGHTIIREADIDKLVELAGFDEETTDTAWPLLFVALESDAGTGILASRHQVFETLE